MITEKNEQYKITFGLFDRIWKFIKIQDEPKNPLKLHRFKFINTGKSPGKKSTKFFLTPKLTSVLLQILLNQQFQIKSIILQVPIINPEKSANLV